MRMLQKVKVDACANIAWAFTHLLQHLVIPNTTECMNEVLVHVFLLSISADWTKFYV